ncbi:MAG TPA: N-acetylmuramoyl-L-alanine amidase [Paludibacteraceae bacterium]|nr:N-acetylmuramoyl-L-alanine amidase [Paludibacteraceae bacterium]
MKRYIIFLLFCALPLAIMASPENYTVVIDAGHGGKDPGALGRDGCEKEINLKVALALGDLITKNCPNVRVVYTRTSDQYVTLYERAKIANKENGDLFICIHTNASRSSSAMGTETYVLGLAKSDANFEVAKRENSVILLEEGYKEKYQGFDPASPESYIMFEFMQASFFDQSVLIADYVQKEFAKNNRIDRGVRQEIFLVLHQTKMPSVLIELGFISNREEERFLLSAEGQQKMAQSIFSAFERYKHEYDKRTYTQQTAIKPNTIDITIAAVEETPTAKQADEIVYKVQIFSTNKKLKPTDAAFKGWKECSFYEETGLIKYTYGATSNYNEIVALKKKVNKDFKDAFIVAFVNGKKIAVGEVRKLQQSKK